MLNDCMDAIFELSEKKQEIIKIVTDTEISKEEALTKAFKDFITMHISSRKNALIICVNQTKNLFLSNTTEKLVIADWRDIINVSSTTWKELTEKYKEETNSFINNVSRSFYEISLAKKHPKKLEQIVIAEFKNDLHLRLVKSEQIKGPFDNPNYYYEEHNYKRSGGILQGRVVFLYDPITE